MHSLMEAGKALRIACLMEAIDRAVEARSDSYTEGELSAEWLAERLGFPPSLGLRALEFSPMWLWLGYGERTAGEAGGHHRVEAWLERDRLHRRRSGKPSTIESVLKAIHRQTDIEEMATRQHPMLALLKKK